MDSIVPDSSAELANTVKQIKQLPLNDNTNAWNTILPTRIPKPALAADINADWLVIGAGYAGLAAARRLAENCPDQKIVIVDAGVCGENASGRNSGFVTDNQPVCIDICGQRGLGYACGENSIPRVGIVI